MFQLKYNTILQFGRYKIIQSLGQGGFGITYKAEQVSLGRKVAIKEFFMKELCERDEGTSHVTLGSAGSRETVTRYREKFLKEARNIAKLNHPNIVRVIDVFEENGTAYYVMEYVENGSLADKVRREGYLSESVATRYILQVAEALDYVHQRKMNHLDVKPANIMLNEKDESVLIDFGLSKQYDATTGEQTSTTPVGFSEGYAPIEQHKQGGVGTFSPETDIYALGATFFKLLTGATPPSASDVYEDGLPIEKLRAKSISERAIAVISKAMEPRKKDRTRDVRMFIDELKSANASHKKSEPQKKQEPKPKPSNGDTTILKEDPKPKPTPRPQPTPHHKPTPKPHTNKKWLWAVAFAAIIIVGAVLGIRKCGYSSLDDVTSEDSTTKAKPSLGNTGTLNGHEWVDLGLSVKWATCNVGATSPGDYGSYYAWGETSTKSSYDWENLKYRTSVDLYDNVKFSKYVTDSEYGSVDNKTRLEMSDDAARQNWGGTWRMPTDAENEELCSKCKWTWTSKNGHNGYTVTGPNGNSIFLPAAGCRNGSDSGLVGTLGGYWSSTLSTSYSGRAHYLLFGSSGHSTSGSHRALGRSVRPVCL